MKDFAVTYATFKLRNCLIAATKRKPEKLRNCVLKERSSNLRMSYSLRQIFPRVTTYSFFTLYVGSRY